MGVFWLQTLVGRHRDLNPGPPACESGIVAITPRGPPPKQFPTVTYFKDKLYLNQENGRHYWESYYGATGKFAGDPNNVGIGGGGPGGGSKSDYSAVFASPYFDYRRTHSRVQINVRMQTFE